MKTAVMITNMGGPDSLDAVEPYLCNIFSDPDIIDVPAPKFLRKRFAHWLAGKRASKSREIYSKIGGKTPLTKITRNQAALLEKELNENSAVQYKVYPAMRYWSPLIEDVWREINDGYFANIIVLSLYPFYSSAATGSIEKLVNRLLPDSRFQQKDVQIISNFGDHPMFIDSMVKQIKQALDSDGGGQYKDVLFSPHSMPIKSVKKGDSYRVEVERAVYLIREQLPMEVNLHLSYQSKVGPVKWLGPSTADKIEELAMAGVKNLLVYPLGFVADNSETIYEIGMLYRDLAKKKGINNYKRIDALNIDIDFIRALKEIVVGRRGR